MKKFLLILIIFKINFVTSQIINIPDINFKNKLLQANTTNSIALDNNLQPIVIDINGNWQIEVSEVQLIYRLQVFSSSIQDLTGIEYFTNIQNLAIHNNMISNLNISTLTQLKVLRCDVNNLSYIDFTGLTQLEALNIGYNNFSTIDINNLPNLKSAFFHYNHFTTLDFSNNPLLSVLQCRNNNLSTLTLKNGINQDFSITGLNDCWKTGNPNLTTICVDDSELASVQNYLNSCDTTTQTPLITSANCGLANEEFASNKVVVYPNPSSNGIYTISFTSKVNNCKIEVFSLLGQKIFENNFKETDEYTIDISNVAIGTYLVTVSSENNSINRLIIKN